jgi:cytosine/adenosine deaminase-related metal-dependent hydrolase
MRLFRARYLVPMAGPIIEDGALLVGGNRILAAGSHAELTCRAGDCPLTDFGAAVLLPPLANAHTHLELTHFPFWNASGRPRSDGGFSGWGFSGWLLHVIEVLRGVPADAFVISLADGIDQVLRGGTGAVGDVLSRPAAMSAYRGSPLRGTLFLETLGTDPDRNRRALTQLRARVAEPPPGGMRFGLAPHALYTLTPDHLADVAGLARGADLPQSLHFLESPEEREFLLTSGGPLAERLYPQVGWQDRMPAPLGDDPGVWLTRRGFLRPGDLLVHGVQVTGKDMAAIASQGLVVVLCPRSNDRLGVGQAPVNRYRTAGVPLVLGTDSLASNDSLSLWDEIAFARRCFGRELDPHTLLDMATRLGARALGLAGEMGVLAAGYGAHFQVLRPACLPVANELEEFLCTAGRGAEVEQLFLAGRQVL